MPFKSQAQRRLFGAKVGRGEISKEKFNEWNKATGSKKLPERIGPKKVSKAKEIKPVKAISDLHKIRKEKYGV